MASSSSHCVDRKSLVRQPSYNNTGTQYIKRRTISCRVVSSICPFLRVSLPVELSNKHDDVVSIIFVHRLSSFCSMPFPAKII